MTTSYHKVTVRYYASRGRWVASCSGCNYGRALRDESSCRTEGRIHEMIQAEDSEL